MVFDGFLHILPSFLECKKAIFSKGRQWIVILSMTRNQMRVATQAVCVTKILALQRWSKIDFPPEFQIRQMHSFPIMYNTMGSKVDGLAVRDHFLPKNGLKQLFWGTQFWIDWLQRGLGAKFLKVSLTSACVFKKVEHKLWNELWARRQISILAESKLFEIFFERDTKKCGKLLEILILKHISRVPPC